MIASPHDIHLNGANSSSEKRLTTTHHVVEVDKLFELEKVVTNLAGLDEKLIGPLAILVSLDLLLEGQQALLDLGHVGPGKVADLGHLCAHVSVV